MTSVIKMLKKCQTPLKMVGVVSVLTFMPFATAAPLADFSFGLKSFKTDSTSTFGEAANNTLSNTHPEESEYLFYGLIEHSIPLIPNVRVNYQNFDFSGSAMLEETFLLNGTTMPVASQLNTNHELTLQDTTLYYELIDISLISLNVGLTGRYQDVAVNAFETLNNRTVGKSVNSYELMGHARLNVDFPLFGFYGFYELNAGNDNEMNMVGVGYAFDEFLAIGLKVEAGYIDQKVEFDRDDGLIFNQEFDSSYIGVELTF